jgi:antitoxin component HigA of HigAB toxin-antitoxin module
VKTILDYATARKDDAWYNDIMAEIRRLMDKDPLLDTEDGARLDALASMVEKYEAEMFGNMQVRRRE